MKKRHALILLLTEAFVVFGAVFITEKYFDSFSSLIAFPFEQIGEGLRALSLKGSIGNGIAVSAWTVLSLLPIIPALSHKDKTRTKENAALFFLSALLFVVLYKMTNTEGLTFLFDTINGDPSTLIKALMGGAVWSTVILYAVLKLLRLFHSGSTNTLLGYLKIMLYVLCALFTAILSWSGGNLLKDLLKNAPAALELTMKLLHFIADALPCAFDLGIGISSITLLNALIVNDRSTAVSCANKLTRLCSTALGVSVATVTALNILQLALANLLSTISLSVELPILSLCFVLVVLLISRLIEENRNLRDEDALFI